MRGGVQRLCAALVVASGTLLLSSSLPAADGIQIRTGFITGNTYLSLSQTNQKTYVMGLVDGLFLAPLFNAPKPGPISNAEGCLVNKTNVQLQAIFKKHLDDHPERWDQWAHVLFYQALIGFCDLHP